MSACVSNLSFKVTQEDVSGVFAEYETVTRVQLPTDRETGRMRGFVEMSSDAEETAAIEALDGAEWMGRSLKVKKAKPREDRRPAKNAIRSRRSIACFTKIQVNSSFSSSLVDLPCSAGGFFLAILKLPF